MARVVFTEPAKDDLLEIEYYIFTDLCNPQAAWRVSDGILRAAGSLADYPESHPLLGDEMLKAMGLRITYFEKYNIFYHYNKDENVVYIIRILYHKADWNNLLRR
ncbi:MAG: type II toxin-antitoxin system RelE/ParE family toxin [Lachnospiraceae bacterium]|nr:type II toxin-antitoxin system RelE/ParE family toxin [Lachnospiraceae bacterium]